MSRSPPTDLPDDAVLWRKHHKQFERPDLRLRRADLGAVIGSVAVLSTSSVSRTGRRLPEAQVEGYRSHLCRAGQAAQKARAEGNRSLYRQ